MSNHLNTMDMYSLFNTRQEFPETLAGRLNSDERDGRVFRAFLLPDANVETDKEYDEAWENAAYTLAYGESAADMKTARSVFETDNDYKKTYLRIIGESSDYAAKRLAEAGGLVSSRDSKGKSYKTVDAEMEEFFSKVSAVSSGIVSDLKGFLMMPDFSALVPATRFSTLAAVASTDALKQYIADGYLPNGSAYKIIYEPFGTLLEIESFRTEAPRVLYYRASGDESAFEQYSAAWTKVKPDKWIMRLSPDYPAIVALPEWNYVILAQSYKSLRR
ncbi:MAG: hypothetical protein LBS84_03335 [Clostridiales bacterium]|nr:hypothetical protein [Clostridiales bacterium]